jgi:hypothetical protein
MRSDKKYLLGIAVIAFSLVIAPVHASSNKGNSTGDKKPSSVPSAQSSKATNASIANPTNLSKWILPAAPTPVTNAIEAQAGSAIPVRFQLFSVATPPAEQTSGIVLITGIAVTCPTNVASPTPTANKITTNITPGKSKASEARYQGKSWNAIWKSDKQAQGCFKLRAALTTPALTLDSPVFVIYPKKN